MTYLILAAILLGADSARRDLRSYRLPNSHSLAILFIGCVVNGFSKCMASALLVSGFYMLLYFLSGRNIGFGDVKFAGACSSVLSHQSETLGAFLLLTWTLGVLHLVIVRWRRSEWARKIPLGPSIYLSMVALLGARWWTSLSQ